MDLIAFGSCAKQAREQPIWEPIISLKPDLFLFLGDNIYADTEDMALMRQKYDLLAAQPGFQKLLKTAPVMATWDDHDYGKNDAGAEYPKKEDSQKIFLDFWKDPPGSPRRKRPGVYDAKVFGPASKRVQMILLDTRYFRGPLKRRDNPGQTWPDMGPYEPNPDPASTMLGETQWRWLEEQLRVPAEIRLIGSSIQVVPEDHHWELWANLPKERERLFGLIKKTKAAGVILLSGDRHLAELSVMDAGIGYPLYDLTSSGLNLANKLEREHEANRRRVKTMKSGDNFGVIRIDWDRKDPVIRLEIRDVQGRPTIVEKLYLSTLQPGFLQ